MENIHRISVEQDAILIFFFIFANELINLKQHGVSKSNKK